MGIDYKKCAYTSFVHAIIMVINPLSGSSRQVRLRKHLAQVFFTRCRDPAHPTPNQCNQLGHLLICVELMEHLLDAGCIQIYSDHPVD